MAQGQFSRDFLASVFTRLAAQLDAICSTQKLVAPAVNVVRYSSIISPFNIEPLHSLAHDVLKGGAYCAAYYFVVASVG